jgi:dihydrofolate synthase/folylpolyglutamate synthase
MTYPEALSWLGASRRMGMKLGLEKMEALARALGSPHGALKFIHIAGTNGKGSTAAFCAAALRGRGIKTGLFTSPHLRSVRERIQIDGVPISREAFAAAITAVKEVSPPDELAPTFFEILTAAALHYFAAEKVEWVVWETGLGGRLDSTNIVTPAVSVITNIGGDHHEFLGPDLATIAAEKGGIIKPGRPAVTAATDGAALAVLRRIAWEKGAPLVEIDASPAFRPEAAGTEGNLQLARIGRQSVRLGLLGAHQARNAACAAAALAFCGLPPFSPEELDTAFAATRWPGRFEIVRSNPDAPLVIDGGHNPDGITAAVAAWRLRFGETPYHLVYGTLGDKDAITAARLLASGASRVSLVKPDSERALDPETLLPHFPGVPARTAGTLVALWPELLAKPEPTLIVGSLVLAGEALRLHDPATEDEEEARLNELLSPRP